MELIKKIKEAETQGQEIIDRAKALAAETAEAGRKARLDARMQAEQQRKQATEASVADAESQGLAEVEALKTQAEDDRRQLRENVQGRIAAAATKIVDCFRG